MNFLPKLILYRVFTTCSIQFKKIPVQSSSGKYNAEKKKINDLQPGEVLKKSLLAYLWEEIVKTSTIIFANCNPLFFALVFLHKIQNSSTLLCAKWENGKEVWKTKKQKMKWKKFIQQSVFKIFSFQKAKSLYFASSVAMGCFYYYFIVLFDGGYMSTACAT